VFDDALCEHFKLIRNGHRRMNNMQLFLMVLLNIKKEITYNPENGLIIKNVLRVEKG